MYEDSNDERPMSVYYNITLETIQNFLFGRKLYPTVTQTNEGVPNHHFVSQSIEHFWERWRKEYLVNLRVSHKYSPQNRKQPTIQIGDIVLIHDENLRRALCIIWRVIVILHGNDKLPRGAVVKTSKSVLKRPINKLYPIEYVRNENEKKETENENENEKKETENDKGTDTDSPRKSKRQAAIIGELRRKYNF